jgi:hypothetical protein
LLNLLVALSLAQAAASDPEPHTLYHQAAARAASSVVAQETEGLADDRRLNEEAFTWGMAMAEFGPLAGRTVEQVDHEDFDRAKLFFEQMRVAKPEAFAAHRVYCRGLLP